MMKISFFMANTCLLLMAVLPSQSQNIGIGVINPQQKLHIGGNVRIDGIANAGTGIITTNANGDLVRTNFSGNANEVLRGNGTFGVLPSSSGIPSGTIVGSVQQTDSGLLNAGFSYHGELMTPFLSYSKFPAGVSTQYLQLPTYENAKPGATPAPSPRSEACAAWTGSEMLVWGGLTIKSDSFYKFLNDGAKYNPSTDSWTPITTVNAPGKRAYASTVWTGSEMLVWGGYDSAVITLGVQNIRFTNTGGRYNPANNTWTAMNLLGAPAARGGAASVWTGTVMVVWGGLRDTGALSNGSRYNPSTNSWLAMSNVGAPVSDALATRMFYDSNTGLVYVLGNQSTCARYNPVANTWSAMPNVPSFYSKENAVWTGSQIWIWSFDKIYKYTPAANTWSTTSIGGALPDKHSTLRSLWTGFEMVFYGYDMDANYTPKSNRFWRYDGGTNLFTYSDAEYNQLVDQGCVLLAAGSMILKWGGAQGEYNKGLLTYRFSSEGLRYYITAGVAFPEVYFKSSYNNVLHLYKKN